MLADPRLAAASGLAAIAGAALTLAGRLDLAAPAVVILLAAAWTAAGFLAPAPDPSLRAGALTLVPGWALVLVWAVMRAGSVHLEDIRGAHAVAGIALFRGPALLVAGAWAAAGAAALLIAAGRARGPARLAIPVLVLEVALAVSLVAGPQVSEAADVLPWLLGSAGVAVVAWVARTREQRTLLRTATGLGLAAALLGAFGGRI